MLKRLAKCVREYKIYVILTLLLIVCEAVIETLIPFITAEFINEIREYANAADPSQKDAFLSDLLKTGLTVCGVFS